MKMRYFLLLFLCAGIPPLVAQENGTIKNFGNQISASELKEYLSIIASDALEGRKTGTRGQKMAASFIANHFEEIGLTPPVNGSYFQPFELYSSKVGDAYVKVAGTRYDNFGEVYYSGSTSTGGEAPIELVFAGRGTEDDYQQIDVKGKAVVQLTSGMGERAGLSRSGSHNVPDRGARIVFLVSESSVEEFHNYVNQRKDRGPGRLSFTKPLSDGPGHGIFMISQAVAEKIFNTTFDKLKKAADDPKKKSLRKIKPAKASYGVTILVNTVKTENVLGFLEGTDKKDEVVIVTAHYDHIGIASSGEDRINNGADDDGSGTVSVMEMAKVFAKAKKEGHGPRRSMLFMTVTGEEMGLLGSEYYSEHPVYPLANTVVDLNIDMVGRTDAEHANMPGYVYIIGSDKLSTELHQLSERANATYTKLSFDYTYNDENHPTNLYKRSDHWNFAKKGIPIIFYFDGIHEDYHKPSDEVSKIEFELLATRVKCVFYTAWEIANREGRLVVDKK